MAKNGSSCLLGPKTEFVDILYTLIRHRSIDCNSLVSVSQYDIKISLKRDKT